MSAFLDPRFKDLDSFVDVADRVDVEEAVKFVALKLAEGNNTDDVVEAVTVNNVEENDILLDETNINQPQDQEQSSSSEVVPPKK